MSEYHKVIFSHICEQKSLLLSPNSKLHYNQKKAFQRMRTDCAVTRMSSALVAKRPIVNRMTDTRPVKHYIPLRSVNNDYIFLSDAVFTFVQVIFDTASEADPGFPIEGGANPPWTRPTYNFATFSTPLHDI